MTHEAWLKGRQSCRDTGSFAAWLAMPFFFHSQQQVGNILPTNDSVMGKAEIGTLTRPGGALYFVRGKLKVFFIIRIIHLSLFWNWKVRKIQSRSQACVNVGLVAFSRTISASRRLAGPRPTPPLAHARVWLPVTQRSCRRCCFGGKWANDMYVKCLDIVQEFLLLWWQVEMRF